MNEIDFSTVALFLEISLIFTDFHFKCPGGNAITRHTVKEKNVVVLS